MVTPCSSAIEALFRNEIRQMQPYVPGEQPQVGKFIKLNTNENPYPPSQKVITAIQQSLQARLERYPDPLGTAFRIRAAEIFNVEPDWILCGNGSDDILTIVTRAFVGPGQALRLPYPSYILYRTLAQVQGAMHEEVLFQPDFSLNANFETSHENLRLVFLPNPNSPSGTIIAPPRIAELAGRLTCPLLVDEAYADFADYNCIDLIKHNPRIMVSRTLSKSYALAGLRFGFLIAHPTIISMLRKVKDSYNCDALSLAGATAAIDDQAWLKDNRQKIVATRTRLTEGMRKLGYRVEDSQANFVWCTRTDVSLEPIYRRLKTDGVLIRYMNYPGWGEGLRISVGTEEQIDACLSLLKSYE
ncbi:MAG: histidinol-phosphate transaminase [Planctomycetales bacterium]|nr:histidinol-phosphate transaminase [Planctomycetales bacterium]